MRSALQLAERGMHVFPLVPRTKRPAVHHDWESAATTDPAIIRRIWRDVPYNIAVAAGPSQLLVIDLDSQRDDAGGCRFPDGWKSLAVAASEAGARVPRGTFMVSTPHGRHLYFQAPDDVGLGNTVGRLGDFVDTRGRGGYVVGPGSIVAAGRYRIIASADPAPLPGWILDQLRPASPTRTWRRPVSFGTSDAYLRAAVRGEVARIAAAPVGQRNLALFRASARLGDFVAAGCLAESDARTVLAQASSRHIGIEGFSTAEAQRTITSGLRAGSRRGTRPSPAGGAGSAQSSGGGIWTAVQPPRPPG